MEEDKMELHISVDLKEKKRKKKVAVYWLCDVSFKYGVRNYTALYFLYSIDSMKKNLSIRKFLQTFNLCIILYVVTYCIIALGHVQWFICLVSVFLSFLLKKKKERERERERERWNLYHMFWLMWKIAF